MLQGKLWIIMPVYNEQDAIVSVITEWTQALDTLGIDYTFCLLNDGSKDNTSSILHDMEHRHTGLRVIDKDNTGHGQTCLAGYRMAVEEGADWVLQLDSDGQCDPVYLPDFVDAASTSAMVFGNRVKREDGPARWIISRFVSVFAFMATGCWIRDANVPYRLMEARRLKRILPAIPSDFHLVNILVSVLVKKQEPISLVPIRFRDRSGGSPSIKSFSFVRHGFKLFRQLRAVCKTEGI